MGYADNDGLEGASAGLQLGGQATDFVLLLMSPKSASSILTSKVKLGGDASAAAGPVGRNASAETDVSMQAEILSYSRARDSSQESLFKVRRCAPTMTRTRTCTARN